MSWCPPQAALEVARAVAVAGFTGLYVDANAVSPERMRVIDGLVTDAGGTIVDGCLIGPVPARQGTTPLVPGGVCSPHRRDLRVVRRIGRGGRHGRRSGGCGVRFEDCPLVVREVVAGSRRARARAGR